MNKLVELLNEYVPQVHYLDRPKREYKNNNFYWYKRENDIGGCLSDIYVISKGFGFIKRLVDNDKIKYNKVPEHIYVSDYSFETIHKGMTDNILMWLAIQDEPIEFLISILK